MLTESNMPNQKKKKKQQTKKKRRGKTRKGEKT
jgi:hypothetical protein